jgi:hypothetical protein
MTKRNPRQEPQPRRIIVEERFGAWAAWFHSGEEAQKLF